MISSTEQIILAVLSTPILIAYLTALIYYVYKYTTLQASPCHLTISANGTLIGMIAMYIFFIRLWRVVDVSYIG
uniref:Uncharacterized protein n=1 Tax=Caenorhabditis japonica TaxID=281687 RepID=A0A8R1HFS4_CAEJA